MSCRSPNKEAKKRYPKKSIQVNQAVNALTVPVFPLLDSLTLLDQTLQVYLTMPRLHNFHLDTNRSGFTGSTSKSVSVSRQSGLWIAFLQDDGTESLTRQE